MKIHSADIPQADMLEDVVKTVILVSQGAKSYQAIAKGINKVERQGRYYRLSAEILGLITKSQTNSSVLTPLGQQFIKTNPTLKNPILLHSVLNTRIFQRLIPFFELYPSGVSKERLKTYLDSITAAIGESMLPRRVMTLLSWLKSLDLLEEKNGKFVLKGKVSTKIPILEFSEPDEPILPKTAALEEYETVKERIKSASKDVVFYKDQAKLERADNAHRRLVNLVAAKIRKAGYLPRANSVIDLAARVDNVDFIFEMKSVTEENAKSQVRRGISQLYEYRYWQNLKKANLVLVIENNLPSSIGWMHDYVELDRNIYLLWDGNEELHAHKRTTSNMPFLFK